MSTAATTRWGPSCHPPTEGVIDTRCCAQLGTSSQHRVRLFRNPATGRPDPRDEYRQEREECSLRECLVIYVDAALDKQGRAGCGLAVFVRGRAVYTESFGFSHMGGSAQLEAHVCAGALDLAAARWPYHRVIVRTDCAPVVRSRMPSSDSFRTAVHEVRERCRRGWRVVRYVSRKANPAHELAREGLKSLSKQQMLAAA